jgi:aldehyde:ferredoxin oxidoreductase
MHQLARGEGFGLIAGHGREKDETNFAEKYGADSKFLNDIGMENKGS